MGNEQQVQDAVVLKVVEQKQGEWVTAAQVAEILGWQFKAVVWSLTRLREQGKLISQLTSYKSSSPKARRGTGEQRYEYKALTVLPEWFKPQGLRP